MNNNATPEIRQQCKAPTKTVPFAAIPKKLIEDGTLGTLSASAVKTLIILCNFRDYHNNTCWPSWNTISRDTGLSRTAVYNSIRELKAAKVIAVKKRPNQSNLFMLICFHPPVEFEILDDDSEVHNVNGGGSKSEPPGVQNLNPNERYKQDLSIQRDAPYIAEPENQQNEKENELNELDYDIEALHPIEPQVTTAGPVSDSGVWKADIELPPIKPGDKIQVYKVAEGPVYDEIHAYLARWAAQPAIARLFHAGLKPREAAAINRHLIHEEVGNVAAWIQTVTRNHFSRQCDSQTCICCTAPATQREQLEKRRIKAAADAEHDREVTAAAIAREKETRDAIITHHEAEIKQSPRFPAIHQQACYKIAYRKYDSNPEIKQAALDFLESPDNIGLLPAPLRPGYYLDCRVIMKRMQSGTYETIKKPDDRPEIAIVDLQPAEEIKLKPFDPSKPVCVAELVVG